MLHTILLEKVNNANLTQSVTDLIVSDFLAPHLPYIKTQKRSFSW